MSNQAFDQLWKRCELKNAREALGAYRDARNRPDLCAAEIDFLDRAICAQEARVAQAKDMVCQWAS